MSEKLDLLLQRLRDTVGRLNTQTERVVTPADETVERTRQAVRTLARSRVSQSLRQLRSAQGLNYEQIQMLTGLSQQLLFDVEYKDRRLTLDEIRLLAACYGVSAGDILGIVVD
jgi:hypothetical protein